MVFKALSYGMEVVCVWGGGGGGVLLLKERLASHIRVDTEKVNKSENGAELLPLKVYLFT